MADERVYGVEDADREFIVRQIASLLPKVRIIAFGSRIRGEGKRYSDLDIALDDGEPIAMERIAQLRERLAESDLPYLVDLSDLRAIDSDFRQHVLDTGEQWAGSEH